MSRIWHLQYHRAVVPSPGIEENGPNYYSVSSQKSRSKKDGPEMKFAGIGVRTALLPIFRKLHSRLMAMDPLARQDRRYMPSMRRHPGRVALACACDASSSASKV